MRILLDTNVLLWTVAMPSRLDESTRSMIQDQDNDVSFSAVSIWEIAIKFSSGRADFDADPQEVLTEALDAGFRELPVWANVAATVAALPMHHRDPFDRLLIAQATMEPARLMTSDSFLTRYSSLVTLVRPTA